MKLAEAFLTRPLSQFAVEGLRAHAERSVESCREAFLCARGYVEAFPTKASRDKALGPAGKLVSFVPIQWDEAENANLTVIDVAVGPALGDEHFDEVSKPVLDALVARMIDDESRSEQIVISRMLYQIHIDNEKQLVVAGGCDAFEVPIDPELSDRTLEWLYRELYARLRAHLA